MKFRFIISLSRDIILTHSVYYLSFVCCVFHGCSYNEVLICYFVIREDFNFENTSTVSATCSKPEESEDLKLHIMSSFNRSKNIHVLLVTDLGRHRVTGLHYTELSVEITTKGSFTFTLFLMLTCMFVSYYEISWTFIYVRLTLCQLQFAVPFSHTPA